MSSDPAKKQYFIFSLIIAILFSFFINYFVAGSLEGPVIGGFPIEVHNASGLTGFLYRLVNTLITGIFLSVPVYYGVMWLQNKR